MRDILVASIIGFIALWALRRPDIGVLGWTWISIMNPHRLTYGFAQEQPWALLMVICTLVAMFSYKGRMRWISAAPVTALVVFDSWNVLTHFAGQYPDLAAELGIRIFKIQFMVFVTMFVLVSRKHLNAFIWVIIGSLAYYGVKGGIFTILHGGSYRVWGPDNTFIQGNNELALALVMTIPLMYYIYMTSTKKLMRWGMLATMLLCAVSALGSQSRGALLAISAMTLVLWWRGNSKLMSGLVIGVVAVAMVAFMPSTWGNRMKTIETYQQDDSAMQRVNVWSVCWRLALDHPVMGGGYAIYTRENFVKYANDPLDHIRNAHSIYMSVLGEHGFVGLAMFLAIWIQTLRVCSWIRKKTGPEGALSWAFWLASMVQVAIIGYMVGGSFLYLAYLDLPYNLLIIAVVLQDWVRRELEKQGSAEDYALGDAWAREQAKLARGVAK